MVIERSAYLGASHYERHSDRVSYANGFKPKEKRALTPFLQELHVSTTFPEVRLKQFIEVRGADAGGWDWISALPALWKGLLYDETTLNQAWDLVKDWQHADVVELMKNVPKTALKTPFLDKNVHFYAEIILNMAKQGLNNLDIYDDQGRCEAQYLLPLFDVVKSGETQADKWLKLYHGEWNQNIDHLFREASHE